jgi:thiosulfate/3-mercaptopyruvate sulfurtransferase
MSHLIKASELQDLIHQQKPVYIFDCSFDLVDPNAGEISYDKEHIPGALYAHSDRDLSGPKNGKNGRHPLPTIEKWVNTLRNWGIDATSHIVAYDRQGGMFAARLWWMLQATGITNVQVLDGGYQAWVNLKGLIENGPSILRNKPSQFEAPHSFKNLVLMADIQANLLEPDFLIVDARPNDRFHGKNEVLDPVGGHIPGAVNRCFKDNLDSNGLFKTPDVLRSEFSSVIDRAPTDIVHSCGSGATACHNLLSMEMAGLSGSKIYAGSWSEWCANPDNPIATR